MSDLETGQLEEELELPPDFLVYENVMESNSQDSSLLVDQNVLGGAGSLAHNLYSHSHSWDPARASDWDATIPSPHTLTRIRRDLCSIYSDPPPGMFVAPDPEDLTKIHALIIGPFDTPYEGGFFHFLLRCPPNYPIHPPKVKLLTTGQGTVRFNPNFYSNGKVCLSILGTWRGPAWSPALSLASLLISIQSLMNNKPYHNEPGFEREKNTGDVRDYNRIIEHETLRVAVLGNLLSDENDILSLHSFKPLMEVVKSSLPDFFGHYEDICSKNIHLDNQTMRDPFNRQNGVKFQFGDLLSKLKDMKERNPSWFEPSAEEEDNSDVSDIDD